MHRPGTELAISRSLVRRPTTTLTEQPCVRVTCTEDCESKREFEQDCCELLISPFRYDQLIHDDGDVEEFVRSAFPEDTPLEKHVSV